MSTSSANVAGSRANPVDLVSPPRPELSLRRSYASNESTRGSANSIQRRESENVLPRWQPDHEASRCPVCQTDFGFWNRRHHCRKCGRVVCAACSPHRITIPRQYVVQPPSGSSDGEPSSPAAFLGGGEVVRVCNPCVPDPWSPDTAAQRSPATQPTEVPNRPLTEATRPRRESQDGAARYRYAGYPPPRPPAPGRNRSQSHQPGSSAFSRSMPQPPPQVSDPRLRMHPPQPPPPFISRPQGHRYSHSHHNPLPPIPPFDARQRPPIPTAPSAPPQNRPRRQIKEEDECPVCGIELPPGESVREVHIQECITSRFSSGTPSQSTPLAPPLAPPSAATIHNTSRTEAPERSEQPEASSSTPPTSTASHARARATSYRPRGMALYKATEKDCQTEDGEPQECVICFEEFEPGDEMGRMECLCKFHRHCIRTWWETKGAGSCPTHQLHD